MSMSVRITKYIYIFFYNLITFFTFKVSYKDSLGTSFFHFLELEAS